jgi:acetyl esterase/lipase
LFHGLVNLVLQSNRGGSVANAKECSDFSKTRAVSNLTSQAIAFQMLLYAMIDDRTGTSRPIPAHMGTFMWTPAQNRAGWTALLGSSSGGATAPEGAVAGRIENLAGLPPTFIGVGSLDLLADEDIEYARRLIDAGVLTELFVAAGAYHGFDLISPDASISKAFTSAKYDALRRAFGLKA